MVPELDRRVQCMPRRSIPVSRLSKHRSEGEGANPPGIGSGHVQEPGAKFLEEVRNPVS